jgi:hypothetical protein
MPDLRHEKKRKPQAEKADIEDDDQKYSTTCEMEADRACARK